MAVTSSQTRRKVDIKRMPLTAFLPIDFSKNVRDPSGSTYDLVGLKNDIRQIGGLTHRPLVHFREGKLDHILQGFRRISAIAELNQEEPHDDRWKTVEVEILENLDQPAIMELMVDHGNTKSLEKHEVVRALWMTLDANPAITRESLVTRMHGLLEIHWPSNKTDPAEIARHYTGTIQNVMSGWRLPDVAKATFMELVKTRAAVAYRKKDFAALVSIFEKEQREDPTGKINKQNPGPVFLEKWKEFVESEEDKANGGNKPKAIAAMSKQELSTFHDNTGSRLGKTFAKLAIRAVSDADKKLLILGSLFVRDVESKLPEEFWQNLEYVMTGKYDKAGFQ